MDGAVNVLRVDAKAGIEYYCGMSALDLCGFDGVFCGILCFCSARFGCCFTFGILIFASRCMRVEGLHSG